jgi:hypothetical protein
VQAESSTKRLSTTAWMVLGFMALGSFLRLVDLTDPPLDFHAWRQLRSANIARGLYYQMDRDANPALRERAIQLGKLEPLEPPLFERLVATTYILLGNETLWIARLYSILFWLIGGLGLYLLGRNVTSEAGAIAGLLIYLLLPFSVVVSRSFLPDVPMTALAILAIFATCKWAEGRSWGWALAAGTLSGLAILVKVFAVFPLAVSTLMIASAGDRARRRLVEPQLWALALLAAIIPGFYYLAARQGAAVDYLEGWVLPFAHLLIEPSFYLRWAAALHRTVTIPVLLLGLAGLTLAESRARRLLIGLWVGYGLIGIAVPSLIISHDYYQSILIPILALSFAPLGGRMLQRLLASGKPWRLAGASAGTLGIAALSYLSMSQLLAQDYRPEVLGWIKMGRELPPESALIGLTHDYNLRIRYYGWRQVSQWPHATDFEMQAAAGGNYDPEDPSIASQFQRQISGFDYFVVTLFDELERQPVVKHTLQEHYQQIDGEGYILIDLRSRD